LIVTSQNLVIGADGEKKAFGGKKDLVLTQLDQLGLLKHTKVHPIDKYFDPPENERQYVLLSIKMPCTLLDHKAHEMKISANLCHTFC